MRTSFCTNMRRGILVIAALVAVVCLPMRLAAQLDRGEITGTVEDQSGAVIPNATITLTNEATSAKITAASTSTGTYVFDGVAPGNYTVEASAAGFGKFVEHGIGVHVQQVNTVDVKLATSNVQQTVTVTAAAPLLETENAQVGQSVSNQAVNDLPLATRDWGSLAQLAAGVTTAATGSSGSGVTADAGSSDSAYFSVNGVNDWQNDFRLNGINDNIEFYGGNYTGTNAAIVPPPDAIQEFTLQSGDFNAEFGHSTGGVINAALKSGTSNLHGDVWEYVRNNDLNANYFFNRNCSSTGCVSKAIPEYHQNLFGFTAGGPVEIPHVVHGRDRLFWFADYQGGRYALPTPDGGLTVPTMAMRNSGFTNMQDNIVGNESSTCSPTNTSKCPTDALGRTFLNGTLFDPATTRQVAWGATDPISGLTNNNATANPSKGTAWLRDPFYNCTAAGCNQSNYGANGPMNGVTSFTNVGQLNTIPTARLDANAVALMGLYPNPETTTVSAGSGLVNNFSSYVPIEDKNTDTWDVRIDANVSPKDIVFGVFDRSLLTVDVPSYFPGVGAGDSGGRVDSLPAYAWAAGYTRIISPTLTNDMHVGMVHSDKQQISVWGNVYGGAACSGSTPTGSCNIPLEYGIQGVPQVAYNGGLPVISIGGMRALGVGNYSPTLQTVWSLEGVDAVTKVYRSHTFKTGIQVDDLEGDISQPPQGRGDMNFNGMYTDIPNRIAVGSTGLNGLGDILVNPRTSLVTPNGMAGVDNVGGQNQFSASNISATDDHRWYIGAYFQDDWKVSPNLTLNLGLRWDLFTPYNETRGYQANFIPVGGNGSTATYYMPTAGCQVARASVFNQALAASNINIDCTGNAALGDSQKYNFAPRVGFAYRLTPTLVVRGGFGTAYGALGNLGYGGTLGTNYPFVYTQTLPAADSNHPLFATGPATMETAFTTVNLSNPATLQAPSASSPYNLGLSLYGRQFNYQTPLVQTENLTIEDQFTSHDAIQVGYVGTQGRHLDILGQTNANSEILPNGTNTQNYIPYPDFARNSTFETTNANSSYNSLQATYQHQTTYGLSLLANYTYSKCLGDQHAPQNGQYNVGFRAQWLPDFGINHDYGLCDADATHLAHVSGTYDLPFGHGRQFGGTMNRAADAILGGWQINFFYTYQSGQPFTVSCPTSTTADFGCVANMTGQSAYSGPHNYNQWLNPGAFAQPAKATTIGQADYSPLGGGVQQVRGPDFSNLDSSLLKNFELHEALRLQFRAEAFNTFNTPPFAQPGQLNFTSGGFSSISATKNSNENNGARTLQLALKMFF